MCVVCVRVCVCVCAVCLLCVGVSLCIRACVTCAGMSVLCIYWLACVILPLGQRLQKAKLEQGTSTVEVRFGFGHVDKNLVKNPCCSHLSAQVDI